VKKKILCVWTKYIESKCKKIHWMKISQWQCIHWYISYCQKKLKKNRNPKKLYYEIDENCKPHLSISQLLYNLWNAWHNYHKYGGKQSRKEKDKRPKFKHSLQHMKVVGGLKVGLERNFHKQKMVCTSRSKKHLCITWEGVSLVCPNSKQKSKKQIKWKG